MNELYNLSNLRRRLTGIPELNPVEGSLIPNTPEQPSPETENVAQPDNTVNTLLKLLNTARQSGVDLPSGYRTPNALLSPRPVTPDFRAEVAPAPVAPVTESAVIPALQEATPVLPDATPMTPSNALLRATAPTTTPVTKTPANSLLDYWAKPVIGKMPLDQFVQIAGALSSAIAPREAVGRVGNVLSQMGGAAYAERVKREDPENVLRKRLLAAQITEAETPKEWGSFYKEHMNTINPKTGKTFTVGETLKKFHEAQAIPKEPTPHYVSTIQSVNGVDMFGDYDVSSKTFTPIRPATPKDIEDIKTGKTKEPTYHYVVDNEGNVSTFAGSKLISGSGKGATKTELKEGEHYEVNDQGEVSFYKSGKLISGPGKGKTRAAPTSENLTMTDVKSAYSMDIGNIKNQMMIEMTPDEQMNLSGQPGENILALLLAGKAGKSLSPERKKYYVGKLQEAEKYYGDLTSQVLGKKGAKISPKVVTPSQEVLKDSQGRELVKDPTSSTGWRFKVSPQELPDGSKIIGKSKKTGNPVYQLPDGSTKEMIP